MNHPAGVETAGTFLDEDSIPPGLLSAGEREGADSQEAHVCTRRPTGTEGNAVLLGKWGAL